jgi:hypothetical protein
VSRLTERYKRHELTCLFASLGGLNASSRVALMEKLARVDQPSASIIPSEQ